MKTKLLFLTLVMLAASGALFAAGGATGGTFTVGSTSCTEVITMGDALTAVNGWSCTTVDITTLADVTNPHQTTSTTTTATIVTGTVVSGDKIQFSCIGY